MTNEERITQLENQVKELLQWKVERIKQQITFPLDQTSLDIVHKDTFVIKNKLQFYRVDGTIGATNYVVTVNGGVFDFVGSYGYVKTFTANTNDTITSVNHGLLNTAKVMLLSTNTLPTPLSDAIPYYVINATTDTFKLSTSSGGSAVDITDTGTGIHFITLF